MSSAGMRGMISNNAGAPHYFQKRDSGDATNANDAAAAGRRRSSQFEKLHNVKRNSQDPLAAARRASLEDSYAKSGPFGRWFQGWTRGTGK